MRRNAYILGIYVVLYQYLYFSKKAFILLFFLSLPFFFSPSLHGHRASPVPVIFSRPRLFQIIRIFSSSIVCRDIMTTWQLQLHLACSTFSHVSAINSTNFKQAGNNTKGNRTMIFNIIIYLEITYKNIGFNSLLLVEPSI